eukprot:871912-Prorocentrum_lima.AAC.1
MSSSRLQMPTLKDGSEPTCNLTVYQWKQTCTPPLPRLPNHRLLDPYHMFPLPHGPLGCHCARIYL